MIVCLHCIVGNLNLSTSTSQMDSHLRFNNRICSLELLHRDKHTYPSKYIELLTKQQPQLHPNTLPDKINLPTIL